MKWLVGYLFGAVVLLHKNVLIAIAIMAFSYTNLPARPLLFTIKNYRAMTFSVRVTCMSADDGTALQMDQKIMLPCGGYPSEDWVQLEVQDDHPLKIVVEYWHYPDATTLAIEHIVECYEPVAGYWQGADIELHRKCFDSREELIVRPFHGSLFVHNKTNCVVQIAHEKGCVSIDPDNHAVLKKYDWYWQQRTLLPILVSRTPPAKKTPHFEAAESTVNETVVLLLPDIFHQGSGMLVIAFDAACFSFDETTSEFTSSTFPVAFFYAFGSMQYGDREQLLADNFAHFHHIGYCFAGKPYPTGRLMQLAFQRPDQYDGEGEN